MNAFNEKEFIEICNRFNAEPVIKEVDINYGKSSYFNKIKYSIQKDRWGEAAFCIIRPNGKVIVVTCEEYPQGIFRIPTGGIGYGEDIIKAAYREAEEELGLKTEITAFAGVIKYSITHEDEVIRFYSYIFIMKETGGRLLLDATDDEVSEVREVGVAGLKEVVDRLKTLEGRWKDWGRLRYESSNAVLEYLLSKKLTLCE